MVRCKTQGEESQIWVENIAGLISISLISVTYHSYPSSCEINQTQIKCQSFKVRPAGEQTADKANLWAGRTGNRRELALTSTDWTMCWDRKCQDRFGSDKSSEVPESSMCCQSKYKFSEYVVPIDFCISLHYLVKCACFVILSSVLKPSFT